MDNLNNFLLIRIRFFCFLFCNILDLLFTSETCFVRLSLDCTSSEVNYWLRFHLLIVGSAVADISVGISYCALNTLFWMKMIFLRRVASVFPDESFSAIINFSFSIVIVTYGWRIFFFQRKVVSVFPSFSSYEISLSKSWFELILEPIFYRAVAQF